MKKNALATLAVLSIFVLSSCSAVVNSLLGEPYQVFEAGQCVSSDELTQHLEEVGDLPVVECTDPHDAEVFAVADTALIDFDLDALFEEAEGYCLSQFEGYVGTTYYDSPLEISASWLVPNVETWELGDRAMVCLISAELEEFNSASLKDAAPFSEPGRIRFEVGECANVESVEDDEGEYFDPHKVDCEEPHQYEIFAVLEPSTSEGAYDEDLFDEEAESFCREEFEPYVGISYEDSKFVFGHVLPTETEWSWGLQEVTCFILVDEDGEATGSVKDAGV